MPCRGAGNCFWRRTCGALVAARAARPRAPPGDFVCLRVRDSGEGMSPQVRERVFEPLFTTKRGGRNSGLGLAIVQEIVQRRRGWIDCESTVGAGTRFSVCLPAASTHPSPTVAPCPQRHPPKTILVVEPDASVLLLASIVLTRQGFRVLSCEEGRQAVERYHQEQGEIHLVVVEDNLPERSGLEVMNELLALNPRLAIVLVSAVGTPAASSPASKSNLTLLNKPYTPEQLVQCVRDALSRG